MNAWPFGPAYIVNRRSDVLARNSMAGLLFDQFEVKNNILRMLFLDPAAKSSWVNWESFAGAIVSGIRLMLGVGDNEPEIADLVDELARNSADFARIWGTQNVTVPMSSESP